MKHDNDVINSITINNLNNVEQYDKKGNKIFTQPKNIEQLLLSVKLLCLRGFVVLKKKWGTLARIAIENDGKRHYVVMFGIGLLNFLATTPFSIIIILPLSFGTALFIIKARISKSLRSQLLTLFLFLFGYFTSIFWWFVMPLTSDFLHLFWLTPFALFGLPGVMAGIFIPFFACGLWLYKKYFYCDKQADLMFVIIFIVCWFISEYVRGHFILGGFPWMLFGHFVPYSFAIQLVKWLGIDLYSILFLLLVLVPYLLIYNRGNEMIRNVCYSVLGLWIINCVGGTMYLIVHPAEKLGVNLFASQANFAANAYMTADAANKIIDKNVKMLSILSMTKRPTLMIMPEGTLNMNIDGGSSLAKYLGRIVPNDNSLLLVGGVNARGVSPYNVVYALNHDGRIVDMYKKQKLVPFGEYIPLRKWLPRLTRSITGDSFDFATDGQNDLFIFYKNLPIIYPIICYESIFPDYVKNNIDISREQLKKDITNDYAARVGVSSLDERKELIVNVTNDVWMGWSVGSYQHFLMNRFLAVATGLPVVRVSNNGFSAFIDSCGRVRAKTKLNQEDLLFVGTI